MGALLDREGEGTELFSDMKRFVVEWKIPSVWA
jgi:hypothetical protein